MSGFAPPPRPGQRMRSDALAGADIVGELRRRFADMQAHLDADHAVLRRVWALAAKWDAQAAESSHETAWALGVSAAELRAAFNDPDT